MSDMMRLFLFSSLLWLFTKFTCSALKILLNISAGLMIYVVYRACDELSSRKHRSTTHMSPFFTIVCRSFGTSTNIFLPEHFNNVFGCRANGLHNGTFNTTIITNYVTIEIMCAWIILITSQKRGIFIVSRVMVAGRFASAEREDYSNLNLILRWYSFLVKLS